MLPICEKLMQNIYKISSENISCESKMSEFDSFTVELGIIADIY